MKKHSFPIVIFIIFYLILYGVYHFTAVGLDDRTIHLQMRRFIPAALALTITLSFWMRSGLSRRPLLSHLIFFAAWLLIPTITTWCAFHKTADSLGLHMPIVAAAYFSTAAMTLHLLFLRRPFLPFSSVSALISLIQIALILFPGFQLLYYMLYKTPFSVNASLAIIQTDSLEAKEYLLENIGATGLLFLALIPLLIYIVLFLINNIHSTSHLLSKKSILIAGMVCLATTAYSTKLFLPVTPIGTYLHAEKYFKVSREYSKTHAERFKALSVEPSPRHFSKPGTILLVIGESASRHYMSAYQDTSHNTTPWLKDRRADKDFILFNHAYSSYILTVPSLERALTEKNQYNDKEFSTSYSIMDLAKKAGYKTYWYSNQGVSGDGDTPITLVAKTANRSFWLEESGRKLTHKTYDNDLLPYLKELNPSEDNFVVLHIMGSHETYMTRYPPEFTRWGEPGKYAVQDNYDNSLAYTDQFLEKAFTFTKEHLNLKAMIYLSDHGAVPGWRRNPDKPNFIALRIPMFVYLSSEYQKLYPEITKTLKTHSNEYFTNDLLYEMVGGILDIKSPNYDPRNSIASPLYQYSRNNLKTVIGRVPLTDDTEE